MAISIDPEKTGKFIAKLRKSHNLTQEQLGDMVFVTRKAVSKWECGVCAPSIDIMNRLTEIFNVSIDEIMTGEFKDNSVKRKEFLINTVHSKEFKVSSVFLGLIFFIFFYTFSIYKENSSQMYTFSFQNYNFMVVNGELYLSDLKSFINLGSFTYNFDTDEFHNFSFNFYTINENGEENIIAYFDNIDSNIILNVNSSKKLLHILREDKSKLKLRIVYYNKDEEQVTYDVSALNISKRDKVQDINKRGYGESLIGRFNENIIADAFDSNINSSNGGSSLRRSVKPFYDCDFNELYYNLKDNLINIGDNICIIKFDDNKEYMYLDECNTNFFYFIKTKTVYYNAVFILTEDLNSTLYISDKNFDVLNEIIIEINKMLNVA